MEATGGTADPPAKRPRLGTDWTVRCADGEVPVRPTPATRASLPKTVLNAV